ncbi:MAG: glycosyltransferase family 2 protein [Pseudomonadota bacterium]
MPQTPTPSKVSPAERGDTISVVVPCKNEAKNLPLLIAEIAQALAGRDFEVIVVDDGSTDDTTAAAWQAGQASNCAVRVLRHANSAGQSAAVRSGVFASRSSIVICTDGDGQNDPAFMPALADKLAELGPSYGMVGGQRVGRRDTPIKRLASGFANRLRGAILADKTRDSGCGLKAIRADIFRRLPYFDGWHRFMAALVLREGYDVAFIDVVDRPRRFGVSKYGVLDRALVGIFDLYGVWWLKRRSRRRAEPVEVTATGDSATDNPQDR